MKYIKSVYQINYLLIGIPRSFIYCANSFQPLYFINVEVNFLTAHDSRVHNGHFLERDTIL